MRTILKWIGYVLGGLPALLVIAAAIVYFQSESILNKAYTAPQVSIAIPNDAATIARGKYLAEHVSVCVDCHGEDFGGGVVVDDPAIGYAPAPNLTTGQGGVGALLTDAEFARVLRYGVLPDNKSVRVMPSDDYQHLSDADLAAIIAYVRSVPPVDNVTRPWELRPLGRILLVTGQLPIMIADRIDPATVQPGTAPAGVTKEYGHYLANIAGAISGWTEADFISAIRTGVDKTGHKIDDEMPTFRYAGMTDDELKAIWLFISTAPPKAYGGR
jgi:mono/diheme cytochrome c family protein